MEPFKLIPYTTDQQTTVIKYLDLNRRFNVEIDPMHLRTYETTWAEKEFSKMTEVIASGKGEIFMIQKDTAIIGFIYCYAEDDTKTGIHMSKLFIEEQYRGHGYGKTAIELLEKELKSRGYKFISLNVFGPNKIAVGLYEKSGFQYRHIDMLKRL